VRADVVLKEIAVMTVTDYFTVDMEIAVLAMEMWLKDKKMEVMSNDMINAVARLWA